MQNHGNLPALAKRVAGKLRNLGAIETPAAYLALQQELNELQRGANGEEVQDARFQWMTHGLDNFERCYVALIEREPHRCEQFSPDKTGGPWAAPGQIMSVDTINAHLKHEHLGKYFPAIFVRVRGFYQRLATATKDHIDNPVEVHGYWKRQLELLERLPKKPD